MRIEKPKQQQQQRTWIAGIASRRRGRSKPAGGELDIIGVSSRRRSRQSANHRRHRSRHEY